MTNFEIQEIISEEIVDETDRYEDNQSKKRAKRMTTSAVMRGCVSLHLDLSTTMLTYC
jgi:metal transporter CNNM